MVIWLASYPRSGNTALRILLKEAFGIRTHSLYDDSNDIGSRATLGELVGHVSHGLTPDAFYALAAKAEETYFIKTHDRPMDDQKALYVVRDGRSAVVSHHHYLQDFWPQRDLSLTDVILGYCGYPSWSEHFEAWRPERRANTLVVHYEDIARRPGSVIQAIGAFLGLPARGSDVLTFADLQRADPAFFRAGSDQKNIKELKGRELAVFWAMHGHLMGHLNYAKPSLPLSKLAAACREVRDHRPPRERNLNETVGHLERELTACNADRADRLGVIQSRDAELASLREEIIHLNNALAETEADRSARLNVIHDRDATIEELRRDLRGTYDRLFESDADRTARLQVIHARETTIEELRGEVERLCAQLADVEADRAARLNVILAGEATIAGLRAESERLHAALNESEADRAARLNIIHVRDEEVVKLRGEIERIAALLSESETDRAARLDVIHSREAALVDLQNEIERLRMALNESEADRAERLQLIRHREGTIEVLRMEVERAGESLAISEADRSARLEVIRGHEATIIRLMNDVARQDALLSSRWWRLGERLRVVPSRISGSKSAKVSESRSTEDSA